MAVKSAKADQQADRVSQLLKSRHMADVIERNQDRAAFAKMLIAVAKFTTHGKDVPFQEIKSLLKEALVMLCGTGNTPIQKVQYDDDEKQGEDPLSGKRLEAMKQLILHNLACINYAEILAYLERGGANAFS